MTTVSIVRDPGSDNGAAYYAASGECQAVGASPGAALDALAAQLGEARTGTMVVVQQFRPDEFFSARQQRRLEELMSQWRVARDQGGTLSADEQAELDELVEVELAAAAKRAESFADTLAS
jgi:hypothetical protein